MSFRDNMQHLRATRNMTQEQLAMLLGVSRQSVSKWEAERAYPEMDKLLKMCGLFECTLDELVTGDLTGRPANGAASIPPGKSQQDVTGYDQAMRVFAWKLPLGISVILASAALALLLSDPGLMPIAEVRSFASALVFVGVAVGLALILPASFARGAFRKAHPFVGDFYTADQKSKARTALSTGLVAGIGLLMAGLAATIVLQADVWLASATFLAFAAVGVFVIVRSALLGARCNLARYAYCAVFATPFHAPLLQRSMADCHVAMRVALIARGAQAPLLANTAGYALSRCACALTRRLQYG